MSKKLANQIKVLRLRKGDILVVEKGFNTAPEQWLAAAKTAGIEFNVPIVFVDEIKKIKVVRNGGL